MIRSSVRVLLAAALTTTVLSSAHSEPKPILPNRPTAVRAQSVPGNIVAAVPGARTPLPDPQLLKSVSVGVLFANVGYPNGFRFSNLGGRRDVYIPVPQGIELSPAALVLVFDDVSAHEARRSLEILVNDRSVSAVALDGKSSGRTVHVPLLGVAARDGFLKLSFLYSGAATQDRCIDVRYVGDSLTMRPESAVEFEIGVSGAPSIAATAALMPQNVAILLSSPRPPSADVAAALTLARSLSANGRQISFYHGVESLPPLVKSDDPHQWIRGLIVVGSLDRMVGHIDPPRPSVASAAGTAPIDNTLAAGRIGGIPMLMLTDAASARAGRLIGNPSLAALRDTPSASVGHATSPNGSTERVNFDELGLVPAKAEVFGRADLAVTVANRMLPGGTRPSRILLDVMVAPDGAGEKAVVSAFVNERLISSSVAAIGEPTRLDLALPEGLVGAAANIRVVVQRRSAQGDCRFEPQGYPAEILGSSSVILSPTGAAAQDFSDLSTFWANGVEVLVPSATAVKPLSVIPMLADVVNGLSREAAPITVRYVDAGATPTPTASFIAVSNLAPAGAEQRVRFDRGRVAIVDRSGRTRLDIGGFASGAVAQIVTAGAFPGLWIKPLSADSALPVAPAIDLDRGDVAFLDKTGVALAMSTERDTLLRVSYPDQRSWLNSFSRFRSWIIGGVWVLVTLGLLFILQRVYRRRALTTDK
ncbi:hypothetical protein RPB_4111 [Rhodopseudomonas palustris HaA2]|uniref:Uncharacterized protein n=1 Tax=Rhodopseudomonas palustris (strain HaA2) TaxID=316058 RepID=Q2ISK6_RHOP2|nr:cellulose biosynthesis cyclic di-GMP-binding regulatory protein BcsB [Rhodopseudomonas palustris]ABD08804.1 hypothetical protein RPB_4111 [Rhodopseudomonas palustris HaA2]